MKLGIIGAGTGACCCSQTRNLRRDWRGRKERLDWRKGGRTIPEGRQEAAAVIAGRILAGVKRQKERQAPAIQNVFGRRGEGRSPRDSRLGKSEGTRVCSVARTRMTQ